VVRTIREIVRIVPDWVWVSLAALLALALAVGARSFVDNRRARALASERERLLRDVGRLERELLPAQLGALSMSVAYRSATELGAGGGFNDAFELDAGRAAILIGDVSGRGPEGLARTGSMRAALRACLEAGMSPRGALASANTAWRGDPDSCFATVMVAVHDPSTNTLTYAGAGHPAPILVGSGAHDPITVAAAPPIGVGLPTGVRQTTVPFARGSAGCFLSDGLIEARARDGLFGRERLTALVAGLRPDDRAEALAAWLIEAADRTKGAVTACLVRAELGGVSVSPRLEEVELEAHELELGLGGRFLAACGVPALASAAAVEQARSVAADGGAAVLLVSFDQPTRRVSVEAPAAAGRGAEAPTAVVDLG
jgi:hypothetical protein